MTAPNPTLIALLDLVQAELPVLSRQVLEATSNALQGNPRHFNLMEPWARRRGRFQMEFETELRPSLAQLRQGGNLTQPKRLASIEGLSLVDEHQALRDVAANHVVELCQEASPTELFQLRNFFNALDGGRSAGRDTNALRPALFARALVNALAGSDLGAEGHYALVRVAAPGLAGALVPLYQGLAAKLRAEDLTPLVSTRTGQERPRRAPLRDSQTGLLSDWQLRNQAVASRPQGLSGLSGVQGLPRPPIDAPHTLLDQLYERMLADPALAPPVKAQLARLQVAVARLAQEDPSLLRRDDHPCWRLINAVAAYASGLSGTQDPRLDGFLRFLETQTQGLIGALHPSADQFARLLREVDDFISAQARERSAPSQAALAALEREQQRAEWLQLLREQLDTQIRPARVGRSVRRFLLGPWADAIVQAMVVDGQESSNAQLLVEVVDPLVDSLRPRREAAERERLRRELPPLVKRIDQGLAGVALSEAKRKALMLELMQLHSRVLSGQVDEAEDSRPAPLDQPDEAELSRFVEERESAYASVWAYAQVDRAALPTQPLPLHGMPPESQFDEARRWLEQLQIGGWFHLCVADSWHTAQLVWINAGRRFFLFISQDADERHSLTEGALVQLYLNGLAMYLEQDGLMERAVGTLMRDLED